MDLSSPGEDKFMGKHYVVSDAGPVPKKFERS